MKIIQYEINELPFSVLDHYCQKFRDSFLNKFCNDSQQFKTHIKDDQELHPWSTWPSVHRGVDPNVHGIRMLNQDISYAKKYSTIWDEIILRNKKIGSFGCLHSYFQENNKNVDFYFPDPFSSKFNAFPKALREFQIFSNNVSKFATTRKSLKSIFNAILNTLRFIFKGDLSYQDIYSFFKIFFKFKAPLNQTSFTFIQAEMSFNRFLKQLENEVPDASFFFSNHLAGSMHRYWNDFFSKDQKVFKNSATLIALKIFESHLEKLLNLSTKTDNNIQIVLVSSMGQDSIRSNQGDDIRPYIKSSKLFFKKITGNTKNSLKLLEAMRPDSVVSGELEDLDNFMKNLNHLRDSNGPIFEITYKHKKDSLTLNLSSRSCLKLINGKILFKKELVNINKIGISTYLQESAQAYHIPEGVLIIHKKKGFRNTLKTREEINVTDIKKKILELSIDS